MRYVPYLIGLLVGGKQKAASRLLWLASGHLGFWEQLDYREAAIGNDPTPNRFRNAMWAKVLLYCVPRQGHERKDSSHHICLRSGKANLQVSVS